MAFGTPGRRVAIIAGVRTPFAKAGTVLKDLSAIDLGKRCVAELIQRTELDGTQVDAVIYGTVVPSVSGDALPAVTVPYLRSKTGLRAASCSSELSARMPLSTDTTVW